ILYKNGSAISNMWDVSREARKSQSHSTRLWFYFRQTRTVPALAARSFSKPIGSQADFPKDHSRLFYIQKHPRRSRYSSAQLLADVVDRYVFIGAKDRIRLMPMSRLVFQRGVPTVSD